MDRKLEALLLERHFLEIERKEKNEDGRLPTIKCEAITIVRHNLKATKFWLIFKLITTAESYNDSSTGKLNISSIGKNISL